MSATAAARGTTAVQPRSGDGPRRGHPAPECGPRRGHPSPAQEARGRRRDGSLRRDGSTPRRDRDAHARSGGRGPARLGRALVWVVVAALALVLAAGVVVPRLAGAESYAVLSGSMAPTHPPGSTVVVRPVDPAAVRLGDVITYQLRPGEPTVVTHRVVASREQGGERTFLTRGDVNAAPDPEWVRAVQVRGVVWYGVPLLGYLSQGLQPVRAVLLPLVVLALLGYAAVQLGLATGRPDRPPRWGRRR